MRLCGLGLVENPGRFDVAIMQALLESLDSGSVIRVPFSQNLVKAPAGFDGILLLLLDYRLEPLHFGRLAGKGSFRARRVRRSLDKVGAMPLESGLEAPDS